MTATSTASVLDTGGLVAVPGLEMVAGELAPLLTVLRAEQARRKAGIAITRPAWKNLVFAGGRVSKARAATALACLYWDLGLLQYGNLIEIPAVDLVGVSPRDSAVQVREAIRVTGDLVMITGAHAWHALPDHGQHLLRCLYQLLTESRKFHGDEPAVILTGEADALRALLHEVQVQPRSVYQPGSALLLPMCGSRSADWARSIFFEEKCHGLDHTRRGNGRTWEHRRRRPGHRRPAQRARGGGGDPWRRIPDRRRRQRRGAQGVSSGG